MITPLFVNSIVSLPMSSTESIRRSAPVPISSAPRSGHRCVPCISRCYVSIPDCAFDCCVEQKVTHTAGGGPVVRVTRGPVCTTVTTRFANYDVQARLAHCEAHSSASWREVVLI